MPEVDFTHARVLGRGRHVARRSFGTLVIDKKLIEVLGGTKGIIGILEAVAESIQSNRQKRRVA